MTGWALHAAGCALVLLVVGASYGFGFAQFASQHEINVIRTGQLNDLLSTAPVVHQQHQVQREKLKKITQQADAMHGRLPSTIRKEEFESTVKKIANEVNLSLENTQWSAPKVTANHSSAEITVNGTGSFASIAKFLKKINQLTRITKVSKLKVESAPDSTRYPFQITFTLVYGVESHDKDERGVSP